MTTCKLHLRKCKLFFKVIAYCLSEQNRMAQSDLVTTNETTRPSLQLLGSMQCCNFVVVTYFNAIGCCTEPELGHFVLFNLTV